MTKQKLGTLSVAFIIAVLTFYRISSWVSIPALFLALHPPVKQSLVNLTSKKIITSNVSSKDVRYNDLPTLLQIPSIDLQKPIVTSPMISLNNWTISDSAANIPDTSAYPNPTSGNTIIFGHDTYSVFYTLNAVSVNDMVYLKTSKNIFTYQVSETKIVPGDAVDIMNQTIQPTLTIFTCDGWFSQNRFVVIAVLKSVAPIL